MIPVSVIIPSLGRPSLAATLTALRGQDSPPAFEIVLAVDGPPAPGLIVDRSLHPQCSQLLRVDLGARRGVSTARNEAIAKATGETLGFLDDDVIPQPGWLAALARHFNGTANTAVTGRILEDGERGTLAALRRIAFDHRHTTNRDREGPAEGPWVDYLNGGNCAVRATALREVGGFDPTYAKSQDRELARRLIRGGHHIVYAQDLVVAHGADYSLADLIRGRYRAGKSAGRMSGSNDLTAVGPATIEQTYGASVVGLARQHGLRLAAAGALSGAAYRLGRSTGAAGPTTTRVRPPTTLSR